MTVPRRTRNQNLATGLKAGEKNPAETSERYDPPEPEDQWPPGRPVYLIVVDQLRDWPPGRRSPSLAELLENQARPNPRTRPGSRTVTPTRKQPPWA